MGKSFPRPDVVFFARVEERHRSREFIAFLKLLDEAYPADTAIKLILNHHSAQVSKQAKTWLATQPEGRFSPVFTPNRGSWCQSASKKDPLSASKRDPFRCDLCAAMDVSLFG